MNDNRCIHAHKNSELFYAVEQHKHDAEVRKPLVDLLREIGVEIEDFRERYPEIAFWEKTLAQIMAALAHYET